MRLSNGSTTTRSESSTPSRPPSARPNQITRRARHTMGRERVRAHHEEADVTVRERRQKIPEIGDHVLPAWSLSVVTTTGIVARV